MIQPVTTHGLPYFSTECAPGQIGSSSVPGWGLMAFWGGVAKGIESLLSGDPLEGYDRSSQYTVPRCTIEVIVGHYRKTPHIINTGDCSGATIKGCAAGGMTIRRWFNPDIVVPAKQLTPFPGSAPLSTDTVSPDDEFAQEVLADYEAALVHARELLARCEDCQSITVSLEFVGFDDGCYDEGILKHLRLRGVTERSEEVTR